MNEPLGVVSAENDDSEAQAVYAMSMDQKLLTIYRQAQEEGRRRKAAADLLEQVLGGEP